MKKMICALALVCMLFSHAFAENISLPAAEVSGTIFEGEFFTITLPAGLDILSETQLEGYEAAVQSDFPDSARTELAALSPDASAAITVFSIESSQDCFAAAQEAAGKILGSSESAKELTFGTNRSGCFACAVSGVQFDLYYLTAGEHLLIVGTSGLEKTVVEAMISGISF